jgi:quercetin dioxygenase-like cupin family protein
VFTETAFARRLHSPTFKRGVETMISISLDELEMLNAWQAEGDKSRWCVQFPLMDSEEVSTLGAVYVELEPGESLPLHTDSRDEIVVLLSGTVEARIGDAIKEISANSMAFIPSMEPHTFRNVGLDVARVLGLFGGVDVVSTFEHDVMPIGKRVLGAPVEAESVLP